MKILFLLYALFFLVCSPLTAQVDAVSRSQSSSKINWRIMSNDFVRVIYPDYMEATGNAVANLIEHYSHAVGLTYGITHPGQITIVIRPETARPNGFVTLAPRRSEWFSNSSLTPFIGALDFNQALSIHEYRHVNQFDFLNQRTNKALYYLFGENILGVAISLGVPDWFFEGDAVWAETALTDGGRGRSPRFAARLKAMLGSQQIPSYDQLLGGTMNTVYPNHYVYGYFLVTRAYRLYGEDIWRRVLGRVTAFALNPYHIYRAFKTETGKDFEEFYNETMAELAADWQSDFNAKPSTERTPFAHYDYPIRDQDKSYFLKISLDSYWGLYISENGGEKLVQEFNIMPDDSRIDIKHGKMAFSQFAPDPRFVYQEFNDLYIYDISTNQTQRLSKNERLYHPQLSPSGKEILAIAFDAQNRWLLSVMDLDGNALRAVAFTDQNINEAVWQDERFVFAIMQDLEGYKTIVRIDTVSPNYETLITRSRNNFFALNYSQDRLFFEADFKGTVQIFQKNTRTGEIAQCTYEPVAAYRPFVDGKQISYVTETADGSRMVTKELLCNSIAKDSLIDFNYLGDTPSDDFTRTQPVSIANYNEMVEKKGAPSQPYNEFQDGLRPHSWSFFGGRGLQLEAIATNYLNTLNLYALVGQDSEEHTPFMQAKVNYMKYYPVFSLELSRRNRKSNAPITNEAFRWRESSVTLGATIPYIYTSGFYHGLHELGLNYGLLAASSHGDASSYEINDDKIFATSAHYKFEYLKQRGFRDIFSPVGLAFYGVYENDRAQRDAQFSSWIHYSEISLLAPGFGTNHGMKWRFFDERRAAGLSKYRRKSFAGQVNENVFSRGYDYYYVEHYSKASYDYAFPIAYPDANARGWIYLKRVYADLFFDYTSTAFEQETAHLKSTGTEFLFDTKIFRKLPLTLAVRATKQLSQKKRFKGEGFISSQAEF